MAVCGLAVWRGGDDERLAAGGYLAAWALTLVVFKDRSEQLQSGVLAIDCVLLAAYVWLALRSRRYWPLFAAGFQLLAIITHLGRFVDARMSGWAYQTAELVWSYLVVISIGYGAWTAPHRRRTSDAALDDEADA